jgi:hypothetical protein
MQHQLRQLTEYIEVCELDTKSTIIPARYCRDAKPVTPILPEELKFNGRSPYS